MGTPYQQLEVHILQTPLFFIPFSFPLLHDCENDGKIIDELTCLSLCGVGDGMGGVAIHGDGTPHTEDQIDEETHSEVPGHPTR